jgi:7,8-dihydropterin-6-yl-methyl-4-(beta-D-ribofuranosyl)aminobenzene 5'-phosphate synthase
MNLREADRVEVTVLVDNYIDALLTQSTETVKRARISPKYTKAGKGLLAEHGLSCLIKVYAGKEEHVILFDLAISPTCFFHNTELLEIDLSKVEAVVLSHGHFDHFGALEEFLKRTSRKIPIFLHPDAFLPRRLNIPNRILELPILDETKLKNSGAILQKIKKPTLLASDLILALGEVERITDFEKGFPGAEAKIDNEWVKDQFFDDQGVVINVKNKGLVVISGCAHAGIINIIKYAMKITKTDKIYAVMGGFHLTGPIFEPLIDLTIKEFKKINPDFIVPMHCTGWKAITQIAKEMPREFLLNTVGTTYIF